MSNLELQWTLNALRRELVLLSTSTCNNIGQRDYSLTVDAIQKQLRPRDNVSLALDRRTSMNKSAITLVIAYYNDRNRVLREAQLGSDMVDSHFFSYFEH